MKLANETPRPEPPPVSTELNHEIYELVMAKLGSNRPFLVVIPEVDGLTFCIGNMTRESLATVLEQCGKVAPQAVAHKN